MPLISGKYQASGRHLVAENGFSLIELVIVIVVLGILLSMAMQSMEGLVKDARYTKNEREMEMLAHAIVGDPGMASGAGRTDFGYVGDVGAFPANLQALYQDPGLGTWDGPYLPPGMTEDSTGFKLDEWGTAYTYSGGITITSTGSGTTISKKIADATDDYLLNTVNGTIKDANDSVPGTIYADSVNIEITIPNGAGGATLKTYHPDSAGAFTLDSLPAGTHSLEIIYVPSVDTLHRYLTVLPRHQGQKSYVFASAHFGGGGGGGGGSGVETLRPTGNGSLTNLLDESCSNNWQCVDEVTSDGDGTYVKGEGSGWNVDTYETANHSVGTGTVDSIVVYVKAKGNGGGKKARTAIRIGGSTYTGSQNNTTGSYVDYSTTYQTNPSTSAAWTWTDIDNLEIGVDLKKVTICTQVWVEVYYTY
ncbi:MAG: prepilin-type N-terminal cleavage/methylation domain-containing protein [candidate division Zixibacteria bacterium]|nr:prepilin-type N-terminal cleavage/methylation domain-containing protein [candidate division Zixibacteria bacterium]